MALYWVIRDLHQCFGSDIPKGHCKLRKTLCFKWESSKRHKALKRANVQEKMISIFEEFFKWCKSQFFIDFKDDFKSRATERSFQRMLDDIKTVFILVLPLYDAAILMWFQLHWKLQTAQGQNHFNVESLDQSSFLCLHNSFAEKNLRCGLLAALKKNNNKKNKIKPESTLTDIS